MSEFKLLDPDAVKRSDWKNQIDSVSNMAKKWDISPNYLKILCAKGKVDSKKIGNTWVLNSNQPKPDINHYNWRNKNNS